MRLSSKFITEALQSAAPADLNELAKPVRKRLSSLGHLMVRFAEACDLLRKSAEKFPGLEPWLREFEYATPCALSGPGWFGTAVTIYEEGKLRVESCLVDREVHEPLADAWNRFHPDKPIIRDSAIEAPSYLRSPVWPALLHLRPLRDFWERALRRDALETLLEVLPDAWLLDPTPLPPGAVIPRLEIPSWDCFASSGSPFPSIAFTTSSVAGDHHTPAQTSADLRAALQHFRRAPHILTARQSTMAPLLLSVCQRTEARTDWLGALALTSLDSGNRPDLAD